MSLDHWFPVVTFPVSRETFQQLPRHPAYTYEYADGQARLSPHPRQYHCLLPLGPRPTSDVIQTDTVRLSIRPMESTELPGLEETFVAAFGHAPPYAEVPAGTPRSAMRQSLLATRRGGSGPIVQEACFVACGQLPGGARQVLGGLVVTLTPAGDLERFDDSVWTEPAPEDALVRRWGRPHLTWVFVHPDVSRHGVASRLLDQAVHALHRLGYKELASTFLLGNESSTLWHWKNGFSLKSYVLSPRLQNRG